MDHDFGPAAYGPTGGNPGFDMGPRSVSLPITSRYDLLWPGRASTDQHPNYGQYNQMHTQPFQAQGEANLGARSQDDNYWMQGIADLGSRPPTTSNQQGYTPQQLSRGMSMQPSDPSIRNPTPPTQHFTAEEHPITDPSIPQHYLDEHDQDMREGMEDLLNSEWPH